MPYIFCNFARAPGTSCFDSYVLSYSYPVKPFNHVIKKIHHHPPGENFPSQKLNISCPLKIYCTPTIVAVDGEEGAKDESMEEERPRLRWVEVGPDITEAQKRAISQLPPKMTKRCKAFMKQIICFSSQEKNLTHLLDAWVRIMKPSRADWLSVLKEMKRLEHPLLFEVIFFFLSPNTIFFFFSELCFHRYNVVSFCLLSVEVLPITCELRLAWFFISFILIFRFFRSTECALFELACHFVYHISLDLKFCKFLTFFSVSPT